MNDDLIITRGMTTLWPFAATTLNSNGVSVPQRLDAAGLRLTFIAGGTPEASDAEAFIIKDNYLYGGVTLTDAVSGLGYIEFIPADTSGAIWPYFPCLLYWGFKAITVSLDEIAIDNGLLVVDQYGVKRTTY